MVAAEPVILRARSHSRKNARGNIFLTLAEVCRTCFYSIFYFISLTFRSAARRQSWRPTRCGRFIHVVKRREELYRPLSTPSRVIANASRFSQVTQHLCMPRLMGHSYGIQIPHRCRIVFVRIVRKRRENLNAHRAACAGVDEMFAQSRDLGD